jgi:serine/threonine protein kinase
MSKPSEPPPAVTIDANDGSTPTSGVDESGPQSAQSLPSEPLPYRDWKRYKIVSFLGVGGMGAVYKAYDPRLHRHVAVKFLRGSHADAFNTRQRRHFEREARAQARIEHPHICKISARCQSSDGLTSICQAMIRSLIPSN